MERGPAAQGRPVRDRRAHALRPVGELTSEPVVLVDAENVRRSAWPNVAADELVERCRSWATSAGARVVVVFDGGKPGEREVDSRCSVVHTGAETADDWLERRAAELAADGRAYWLVTSDRALRSAAGDQAERTVGGGSFLRELVA